MADVDPRAAVPERRRDRLKRYMRVPLAVRTSDLPVRVASAFVMLAVAGLALWLGGAVFDLLIGAVAAATLWEWTRLVLARELRPFARGVWLAGGLLYIGGAAWLLLEIDQKLVPIILGVVICTDSFAYFAGRTIGGRKIAPRISPSKTWAGLLGGMAGAGLFVWIVMANFAHLWGGNWREAFFDPLVFSGLFIGALLAVAAQLGDFFESWMKRKAAMKDSSNLIPGHGGVFDRVDGLLPVAIIVGLVARALA